MSRYTKTLRILLLFLLSIAASSVSGQTTDKEKRKPADFFGSGSGIQSKPQSRHVSPGLFENNQGPIGEAIEGSKNPERIPEYMVWGMFLQTIHRLSHQHKDRMDALGIRIMPERQTLDEAVGLTPQQFQEMVAIADRCSMRAVEISVKHRDRINQLLGNKSITELPEDVKRSFEREGWLEYEEHKELMFGCKQEVLSLLNLQQQEKLKDYLLKAVARNINIGILPNREKK